jgi:hypothetical protein
MRDQSDNDNVVRQIIKPITRRLTSTLSRSSDEVEFSNSPRHITAFQ